MGIDFPSIAHTLRSTSGGTYKLGHLHEALAAALGYKTYASLKASVEEAPSYDGAKRILLDEALLGSRLAELGHATAAADMSGAIKRAFRTHLPEVRFYANADDLQEDLHDDIAEAIETSSQYESELTITNADGERCNLELDAPEGIEVAESFWLIDAMGTSRLEQHSDRVYHGGVIKVSAQALFPKLGRRILGDMEVQDIDAKIESDWADDDPQDDLEP